MAKKTITKTKVRTRKLNSERTVLRKDTTDRQRRIVREYPDIHRRVVASESRGLVTKNSRTKLKSGKKKSK